MSWYAPNWLTGYDEENAQRGAAAAAERERIRQNEIAAGKFDPDALRRMQQDYASEVPFGVAAQEASIDEAFDEGWQEGRQNISSTIKNTLNRIVADPLRAVIGGLPWWLWVGGALALFGWLGGFGWVAKKVKGRLA